MSDNLSYGAGGGLIGAILGAIGTFLGTDRRITKVENENKEIKDMFKDVVFKDVHDVCKASNNQQFGAIKEELYQINTKQDITLEKLNQLIGKINK